MISVAVAIRFGRLPFPRRYSRGLTLSHRRGALIGVRAPLHATEVEPRVREAEAAGRALSRRVVLEELHRLPADGARGIEDVLGLPEEGVLSGTDDVHQLSPLETGIVSMTSPLMPTLISSSGMSLPDSLRDSWTRWTRPKQQGTSM